MEEDRTRPVSSERGVALVVVLVAIVVLLPPTILLSALAIRWQRQTIDLRDGVAEEFAAHAGFEEARNRIASTSFGLAPNEATSFLLDDLGELTPDVRIAREQDVVLTVNGRVLTGPAAANAELERTGVDAEGRTVYQYRKLEIYVVEVEVRRRPTLRAVKLEGVVARLPDGSLQTLGVKTTRGFW